MRSSIRFKVSESRSKSSLVPRTGHALREVAGDDRLYRAPDRLDALEQGKAERYTTDAAECNHCGKGAMRNPSKMDSLSSSICSRSAPIARRASADSGGNEHATMADVTVAFFVFDVGPA